MKVAFNNFIVLFLLSLFLVTSGFAMGPKVLEGKFYDDFSLYDYKGNLHSLESFTNKRGIVLMFIATQCPVSNAYNDRMAELFSDYKESFSIVGINSNKQEDVDEIESHAEDNNLEFIILKDSNNVVADKFEASFTPEIYVLSNDFELLYHGRIDDSRRKSSVKEMDLRNALNEIMEGKPVSVKETKAFGCSIKRVNK